MAELHISKKSISALLKETQGKKFIIPDFQRPYKWDIEKCETLWEDIEDFYAKKGHTEYFLGTIVFYKNEDGNFEIIDGQQRITSFFLLLRAFYAKLEGMTEDDAVRGLKSQIAPCIWDIDSISQMVSDKSKIHLESRVATEKNNHSLHHTLINGETDKKPDDNYTKNYQFFIQKANTYAQQNPMHWKQFCVTILNKCIILPIECNTSETALTIFSTLNDRGMPLDDSDIFKAQIYQLTPEENRTEFIQQWQKLSELCKQAEIGVNDIFRYYSHVIRARNNDRSKEIGLRPFYAQDKYAKLKQENLIEELIYLAHFWQFTHNEKIGDETANYQTLSTPHKKFLQCLKNYPNEYWKYVVSVFVLRHQGVTQEIFLASFENLLHKLTALLFFKFIEKPTVNAIKDDVFNLCVVIQNNQNFSFPFKENDLNPQKIDEHASSRIARALLFLDAYLNPNQKELIPSNVDIEHIFPKKWQDTNYHGWNRDDAEKYLEMFGNKVVLESKLNIQAGNGYFGKKKDRYLESKIANVLTLANKPESDWQQADIEQRNTQFKERLTTFFKVHLLSA